MLRPNDLLLKMSEDLAMLPAHLEIIIRTAPFRYKLFEIPKKAGGMRQVAQPAREVKAIQRWMVNQLEPKLPIHKSATAYCSGSSIKKNAEAHAASRFMLKLDFKNFFPSITRDDILLHFERHLSDQLDPMTQQLVAHACCWMPERLPPFRLCIGAPSSPMLSNSIMYELDCRISTIAEQDKVVYTRYADDITLSSRERGKIDRYSDLIKEFLTELPYPKLKLNVDKTVRASRAGRRIVTGLVLTPDGNVSIGRDRKRLIRAMYHRSLKQELDDEQAQVLVGLLAFADNVEPGFSQRLKKSVRP